MALVDLSISRKGLMLVSVPMLFELIFVGTLLLMLQASEKEVRTQASSRDMVATMSDLSNRLMNAGYMLFLWRASHSEDSIQKHKEIVADIRKLCVRLSEVSRGNERREEHARKIAELSERVIYLTTNFAAGDQSSPQTLLGKETYCIELERVFQACALLEHQVNREEQAIQAGGSGSEQRVKSMLYTLIFSAISFNILLTVLLAIYFSRSITRRLSTVMENTELLSIGRPLHQPLDGRDEIARLDHVFHRMAAALEQSERTKSDFVSMITHDLKAPLSSIKTAADLLASSAKDNADEKQARRLGVLQRNVTGMVRLVTDLLDMDKLEGGALKLDLELAELGNIVRQAVDSMLFFAEQHNVELQIESPPEPVELECDAARVEQVVTNLITNSIKFSRAGGVVTISYDKARDFAEVDVIDRGRGIPQEDLDKIFDRFKQVEQDDSSLKGGTGLGLAICKALVELHHGTISVRSKLEEGSVFTFRLPLSQARAGSSSKRLG